MIRWFLLIVVVVGCVTLGKMATQQMNQSMLITDVREVVSADSINTQYLLFDTHENKTFSFIGTNGFIPTLKALWPVWSFVGIVTLLLLPLVFFIIRIVNNDQINRAIQSQKQAESEAEKKVKKIWEEAKSYEQQAKSWAENKVSVANERADNAYSVAKKDALKELDDEKEHIKTQHEFLHSLKESLDTKESKLNRRIGLTNDWIMEVEQSFEEEQASLDSQKKTIYMENQSLIKARDNAQAAMQRYKRKYQSLINSAVD